jgi:hypothetical protein
MAVVLGKHTLGTNYLVAILTEILNFFLWVSPTEDFLLLGWLLGGVVEIRKKGRMLLLLE